MKPKSCQISTYHMSSLSCFRRLIAHSANSSPSSSVTIVNLLSPSITPAPFCIFILILRFPRLSHPPFYSLPPFCPGYVCGLLVKADLEVSFSPSAEINVPAKGAYHPFTVRSGAGGKTRARERGRWEGVTVQWAGRGREGKGYFNYQPSLKITERNTNTESSCLRTIFSPSDRAEGSSECFIMIPQLLKTSPLLLLWLDIYFMITQSLQLYISFNLTQQQ